MSTETSGVILKGDRWSYLELGELQRDSRRQELERLNKEISRWYNMLTLSLVFGADSPEARKQLEKLYERRGIQMITEFPADKTEDSGPRKKANLMAVMQHLRSSIRDLKILLETSTPQAKNLLVHKEIEKLERSAEKVQMGLQELVL